jgi:hypothetical protein
MHPRVTAWLASMRAEAEVPGTIIVCAGRLRLLPDEIVGKSDDELFAYVSERLENTHKARTA